MRRSDEVGTTEADFVAVVARWAHASGVDRRTLSYVGVPAAVLKAAGVKHTPVPDLVRPHYSSDPLTATDLVRRSGATLSSVRTVIAADERSGLLERVRKGTTVAYRLPS